MGLAAKMTKEGHAVALLTGESTPEQRIAVLNRFRDGKEKVLITTNLMARGIDIEQVYKNFVGFIVFGEFARSMKLSYGLRVP